MAARLFLGISALLWLGVGLYYAFDPGVLAGAAGVSFSTPTGATDMRATYGGLAVAIGALAAAGALHAGWRRPALLTLAVATAGFAGGRLLGVGLDGGLSGYTLQALGFELGTLVIALVLLRRPGDAAAGA
jgi:Domain of unknown function (DUF4345)